MGTGQIGAGGCLGKKRRKGFQIRGATRGATRARTRSLIRGAAARGTVAMSPRHGAVATVLRWRIGSGVSTVAGGDMPGAIRVTCPIGLAGVGSGSAWMDLVPPHVDGARAG